MADKENRQKIDCGIIGLEKEYKSLQRILVTFKKEKRGNSCLLCGKPRSGKSLILEQILEQHFADKLDEIFYIDCYQMHSKKKLDDEFSKISSLTESASALVIIDHFEQLAQRSQNFLYQVLDLSRRRPCFVLLVGNQENGFNLLEKRVKSRLSKNHVNLSTRIPFKAYFDGFLQLLKKNAAEKLLSSRDFEKALQNFYFKTILYGFSYAKRLAVLVNTMYEIETENDAAVDIELPRLLNLLSKCSALVLPDASAILLERITIRQICLLKCVILQTRQEVTYDTIIKQYKWFVNEFDTTMRVADKALILDLDELVSIGLLASVKHIEFLQPKYRRVSSNVDNELFMKCAKAHSAKLPTNTRRFIFDDS